MAEKFDRFCTFIEAGRNLPAEFLEARRNGESSFSSLLEALSAAGFQGSTVAEIKTLIGHQRNYTETRKEHDRLNKELLELIQKYGTSHQEFSHRAVRGLVPADDARGQTVLHDLGQFEEEAIEAQGRLGKSGLPLDWCNNVVADDPFAWVYALRSGMLD